jgi:Flp pilus assembly protein TadG
MIRLFRLFRRCERGAAAIEFGLMAPLLIVFHFGAVEFVQAWEAHRRVTHVAAALADLTAQKRAVTQAELDDILKAGGLMMSPFPVNQLGVRISSFAANGSGTVNKVWSTSRNWTDSEQPSVPKGYLAANESVIVADVTFKHRAMFGLVLSPMLTMRKHAYLRPRLSNEDAKL